MFFTAALTCLALNIYYEARSEPINGQIAVALVTRNRMNIENKSACEVVFENKQFSWANDVKVKMTDEGIQIDKKFLPDPKNKAWLKALYIAELSKIIPDFTGGATHYHVNAINPWPEMEIVTVIGNHTFCRSEHFIERHRLMRMR